MLYPSYSALPTMMAMIPYSSGNVISQLASSVYNDYHVFILFWHVLELKARDSLACFVK